MNFTNEQMIDHKITQSSLVAGMVVFQDGVVLGYRPKQWQDFRDAVNNLSDRETDAKIYWWRRMKGWMRVQLYWRVDGEWQKFAGDNPPEMPVFSAGAPKTTGTGKQMYIPFGLIEQVERLKADYQDHLN